MTALGEDEALEILGAALSPSARGALVGIGDDCAVLRPTRGALVWTIDACQEGTHYRFEWMSVEDVAHRSLHAAVSDLAAMGARPRAALCQLTLAKGTSRATLTRFARAQADAARALGCPVVGGNITSGRTFDIVITAFGEAGRAGVLARGGAREGDEIWVLGALGHARAGLLCLQRGRPARGALADCVRAFRRPQALVAQGERLCGRATSCLDVSDGLARDAGHLAREGGVRLVLRQSALLEDEVLGRAARLLEEEPLALILEGGEDYALLATGPGSRRPRGARVIGTVEAGRGVWLEGPQGRRIARGGYQHRT